MSKENRHRVYAHITNDQYDLTRRKLFVEDLNWQTLLTTLINAYVMGDISVTQQGRYHVAPPSNYTPILNVPKGADIVEIEPDWGGDSPRPQVGATSSKQKPRRKPKWGTREVSEYLRNATGRRINPRTLRKLINHLDIPKGDNGRWSFEGPDDPNTIVLKECIEEGLYDEIVRMGTEDANERVLRNKSKLVTQREAEELTDKQKRIKHLQRLRDIESS